MAVHHRVNPPTRSMQARGPLSSSPHENAAHREFCDVAHGGWPGFTIDAVHSSAQAQKQATMCDLTGHRRVAAGPPPPRRRRAGTAARSRDREIARVLDECRLSHAVHTRKLRELSALRSSAPPGLFFPSFARALTPLFDCARRSLAAERTVRFFSAFAALPDAKDVAASGAFLEEFLLFLLVASGAANRTASIIFALAYVCLLSHYVGHFDDLISVCWFFLIALIRECHDDSDADDDEDESSEDDDGERRFRRRRRTSGSPPPYSSAPHMLLALSGAASGGPGSTHTMAAPITVSSGGFQGPPHAVVGAMPRKRFRTKFSSEQKERMQEMSERLGWRMQKKDEAVVEEFCRQIGVERGIFKVWMHNNKHTYHGSPSSKRNEVSRGGGGGGGGGEGNGLGIVNDNRGGNNNVYNGCTWKGGKLRLEKAKEHYFARLKREWAEDVNLATTVHLDMKKDAEHLKMSECLDQEKMQFRIFFPKLRKVCLMTDDTILDTVLERQLGFGHSMRSKKSRSSSSGRSDDASVPEAVRTSMSMMQDQISYWMNRSQTFERIVAAVAGRLGIDASKLAPLQSHDAASAPPSRHVSGQGSTSGGGNEANESNHT
ncbi:uncharacterized protein [Elaeis guineensis]|uniref:uncharacterized protein n=1 Tax=Elaeis guineensis var. tenera TaxID=51953 RepID=UPI003C6D61AD